MSDEKRKMRVWIVRHGETQANRDGIIQGQLDVPLNEEGLRQAKIVGQALKKRLGDAVFDYAYTSDLSRAAKTAQVILEHYPGIEAVKQEALRERFMGGLQGEHFTRYGLADAEIKKTIETVGEFENRAINWWKEVIVTKRVRNVLVTSHGGFITTLVRGLVGGRKASCGDKVKLGQFQNTAICVIEVDSKGKGIILEFGNISHLSSFVESNVDVINT